MGKANSDLTKRKARALLHLEVLLAPASMIPSQSSPGMANSIVKGQVTQIGDTSWRMYAVSKGAATIQLQPNSGIQECRLSFTRNSVFQEKAEICFVLQNLLILKF